MKLNGEVLLRKYNDKFSYEFISKERNLSTESIEAFQPQIFKNSCWSDVRNVQALRKFHNMQKEGFYSELISVIGEPLDELEYNHVELCSKLIYKFADSTLDLRSSSPTNLLAAIQYRRLIDQRTADLDSLSILELGPGCGYLPLFFASHPNLTSYRATECTKGLYIYQSILWFFALKFFNDIETSNLSKFVNKFKSHYSVWEFADLTSSIPPSNVIISNHCLAEMSEKALICYAKRILYSWRLNKVINGRWIAQSLGSPVNNTWTKVVSIMNKVGFKLIENATGSSKFSRIFVWRDSLSDPLPYESQIINIPGQAMPLGTPAKVLKGSRGLIPTEYSDISFSKYHKLFHKIFPEQQQSLDQKWADFINLDSDR